MGFGLSDAKDVKDVKDVKDSGDGGGGWRRYCWRYECISPRVLLTPVFLTSRSYDGLVKI